MAPFLLCRCRLLIGCAPPVFFPCRCRSLTTEPHNKLSCLVSFLRAQPASLRPDALPSRARSLSYSRHYPQSRPRPAQADSDYWWTHVTHVPCLVKTAHTDRLPSRARAGCVTSPSGPTALHHPAPSTGTVMVGTLLGAGRLLRRPSHFPSDADNGWSPC